MIKKTFLIFLFTFYSPFFMAGQESVNNIGRKVFKRVKQAVYQVKVAISKESSKVAYGSGFVIDKKGLLITNFHVISVAFHEPEKYKVFIELKGHTYQAHIQAIDVVNDLALIRVNKKFPSYIRIRKKKPVIGEKIFSVGIPKDLNLSLVEGIYNGTIKKGVYKIIHMSSPLNAGMSGGPTVDGNGNLLGVNVSILLESQNISFAVPAQFVRKIIKKKSGKEIDLESNKRYEIIKKQLVEIQNELVKEFEQKDNKINLFSFSVPDLSSVLKCWTRDESIRKEDDADDENREDYDKSIDFHLKRNSCHVLHAAYVEEDFYSGSYQYTYMSLKNFKLNPWQFFSLVDILYNQGDVVTNMFLKLEKKLLFSHFACSQDFVVNNFNIPFKINYCLKGHKHYPGLYSIFFKAATLSKSGEELVFKSKIDGFNIESFKKFVIYYLDSIKIVP